MTVTPDLPELEAVREDWRARWPQALELWSRFTRLSEPHWCLSEADAAAEGLTESFSMIRLSDQAVVVSLPLVLDRGVQGYPLQVLGHEVGHHVYCPADLTDHARMIARMRWGLPGKEHLAGFVANLYADLLINDRLQRDVGLSMANVFVQLAGATHDRMWAFYMRIYEILWSLPRGTLARWGLAAAEDRGASMRQQARSASEEDSRSQMEGDAYLGARLIRSYARDWVEGSGRFAALCLPYLLQDEGQAVRQALKGWLDAEQAGDGDAMPAGLTEIEPGEREGAIHPALDPALSGLDQGRSGRQTPPAAAQPGAGASAGQHREPFQYGQILRALGMKLDDHEVAVRYYRERAAGHLVPFPTRVLPESTEPLPEGLEPWDVGSPVEDADWTQSVLVSPQVIPGFTTVQRVWGTTQGQQPRREPLDLDLYVDSSGSMPDPRQTVSFLALAGAIVALSALRVGARVQATLWSGAQQFETTRGFIGDEQRILRVLSGYIGGNTAFPIHLLRDTFAKRTPRDRPVHIMVISDNGVTTMFEGDERRGKGWKIARMALANARGGGSLVLNLAGDWQQRIPDLARASQEGWQVSAVATWEQLVEFASRFSRMKYGDLDE